MNVIIMVDTDSLNLGIYEIIESIFLEFDNHINFHMCYKLDNYKSYLKNAGNFDFIILGIGMNNYGYEIANYIKLNYINKKIIFVSKHEELVISSFAYKPYCFLRKNYLQEDIGILRNLLSYDIKTKYFYCYKTNDNRKTFKLEISTIYYIVNNRNYVNLYKDRDIFYMRIAFKDIQAIKQYPYLIPNRGVAINVNYISYIEKDIVYMQNGFNVNISKSRKKDFYEKYKHEYIISV